MAELLLIEPDRQLGKLYSAALQNAGHTVRWGVAAQQGIRLADKQLPHMVILELQLVAHGGIEFLYEFCSYADWSMTPIIIHSLVPPSEFAAMRDVLRQLGVADYLYKPQTTLRQLVRAANNILTTMAVL